MKTVRDGGYEWPWEMFADVPIIHQRYEAIADLMDAMRTAGLVLTSKVGAEIIHGVPPVMVLSFTARPMTKSESAALLGQEEAA